MSQVASDEPKPPAFTRVETQFQVLVDGDSGVGSAKIVYARTTENRYSIHWDVEASGILALVYPNLVQTSDGSVNETGLKPEVYTYQFGNKQDKNYKATFSWSDKIVNLETSKGKKTENIEDGTQDFLSFMYQFMFVPPLESMRIAMTNGKKIGEYHYEFVGEETLSLKFGEVKTYHIQHAKADSEDKTELWLAVDYQFVPVKIKKTEKNGRVIEQIATELKTELPNTFNQEVMP